MSTRDLLGVTEGPGAQTSLSERTAAEACAFAGKSRSSLVPGAETNASCFHILFVAGLWVGRGTPGFPVGDVHYGPRREEAKRRRVLQGSSHAGLAWFRGLCPF